MPRKQLILKDLKLKLIKKTILLPLLRELTTQEEIERLKAKISLLEIENEFLKKLDEIERK